MITELLICFLPQVTRPTLYLIIIIMTLKSRRQREIPTKVNFFSWSYNLKLRKGERNSQIGQLGRFRCRRPMQDRDMVSWKQWNQTFLEDNKAGPLHTALPAWCTTLPSLSLSLSLSLQVCRSDLFSLQSWLPFYKFK